MALIDCPFCGRSGVSDQALWCPGCDRNVKEYFYQQNKEAREAAIRENVAAAFQREMKQQDVVRNLRKDRKYSWIAVGFWLILILWAVNFAYGFGTTGGYVFFGLVILAELIGLGFTIKSMIGSRIQQHRAKKDTDGYLADELAKRQQAAVDRENETHMPYQAQHSLTQHICPHCGYDCDYMEHVCKECGADLSQEPIPNPTLYGDASYQWCPKCGYRYLRTKFTDSRVSSATRYQRWCPECGYVLQSNTFKR